MRFIDRLGINVPPINQEFELGDLTILIGRSNSGKTRILNELFRVGTNLNNILRSKKSFDDRMAQCKQIGVTLVTQEELGNKDIKPIIISSPRTIVGRIDVTNTALNKITDSVKKMDNTLEEFGNAKAKQAGVQRGLETQGSGVQNLMQIISQSYEEGNFLLIDEPEISQFPIGKIEILRRIIEQLDEKQIVFATHDPTLINQYLIKKIKEEKKFKITIYSFCEEEKFKKIDFETDLDPEIHAGYLSQTYSGKPVHVIVEGQTEFYAFQALIVKYCLYKKLTKFPSILNKIGIGYLAGGQWKINIHHLPPIEYYTVLVVLDGEHKDALEEYKNSDRFKVINSVKNMAQRKTNIFCLNAINIEKAFKEIFPDIEESPNKPHGLAERIWNAADIIERLKENYNSSQIYDIVSWLVDKASKS